MSPAIEKIVLFVLMGLLVALFAWIYVRNRQQRVGLWVSGWIAILIHLAAELVPSSSNLLQFSRLSSLEMAGVFFTLSVSYAHSPTRRRVLYLAVFGFPSIIYTAFLLWAPGYRWVFPTLIVCSTIAVTASGWRYNDRGIFYYVSRGAVLTYALWSAVESASVPMVGVLYYLVTLYVFAGLLQIQYLKRVTPGVLTTSFSFILWAITFPTIAFLEFRHIDPLLNTVVWDLPKYLVAFGMILTLFENETLTAVGAARQYRSLFEGNLAAVYVSTPEGKLLDCNPAFVHTYGYSSKEEMLGWPTIGLYCNVTDRDAFVRRLHQEGQVINYESTQLRKDGSTFWILERATMFRDPSGRMIIEGTFIDITERKQTEIALKESEERFATIFHHSPVGCGIVSLDGIFLNGNAALAKLLGRPVDQIVGKTGVELGLWKSQADRDRFYQRMRSEGSISNMEIQYVDSAGNRHIGLYFGTLVHIADKEHIFGMQLDCTEQRELEAKFLQAQKMEAVGRLAGGVAHDFNNLLGIIGGYAELLETHLARDEKGHTYSTKIVETTRRARGLTSQLLTFSRNQISQPGPLDPNATIRELASILPRLINEDIEIVLNLDATGIIVMDKIHFEQIVLNIVVNARDAMPAGGQLTIATADRFGSPTSSPGAPPSRMVEIQIRDTGTGMDEDTRLRAFEPFFTTKETGRGTGLGLATVYGIVQQCGGDIKIESRLNQGTQISISLPGTERVETPEEPEEPTVPLRGSGRILLVEDEVDLRDANCEFLVSIGYDVTCAGSGVEALQILNHVGHIDLVISDVVMPKMSGSEFAARLHEARPSVKLLFVSGHSDDVIVNSGIRSGTPFLQKPYSMRQLAAKIHEVLDTTLAKGD